MWICISNPSSDPGPFVDNDKIARKYKKFIIFDENFLHIQHEIKKKKDGKLSH